MSSRPAFTDKRAHDVGSSGPLDNPGDLFQTPKTADLTLEVSNGSGAAAAVEGICTSAAGYYRPRTSGRIITASRTGPSLSGSLQTSSTAYLPVCRQPGR